MPLVDLGPAPVKKKGLVDLGPAPTPITEAIKAIEEPPAKFDFGLPSIADPSAPPEGFVPGLEQPSEKIRRPGPTFRTTPRDIRPPEESILNKVVRDISAIGKVASQYVREGEPYPGEISDRLKNMITRAVSPLTYVIPGVTRKDLIAELDREAEKFTGFGPAVVPAAGKIAEEATEWIALMKAFGLTHKAINTTGKIPVVARTVKAMGETKFAQQYPRIYAVSQQALKAFLAGEVVGQTWGALEGVEEGDILKRMNVKGATLGTVAAGFSLVSSIDNARHLGKLRKVLVANTRTRYSAKIKALPKGMANPKARALITQEKLELQQIDNIVSAAEAQLIGMKSGKLARGAFEAVESPRKAAERIIKYGYKPGKGYTVGQPQLKKGLGKAPKKPLMPTTRAGEVVEQVREVVAHPVKAVKAKARPTVKPPTVAKITPTRPVQPITPTKPTVTPKAEGKVEFKRLISPTTKGMYFNLNEETGQVAFLVPFKSELGHPDPRYQAKPVKATVADLAYHFAKLDKPIQKAFAKWRDEFAKKNPDKYNELINQPLTKGYLQPQEQAAPTPKPEVPAKPKLVDLGPAPEKKAIIPTEMTYDQWRDKISAIASKPAKDRTEAEKALRATFPQEETRAIDKKYEEQIDKAMDVLSKLGALDRKKEHESIYKWPKTKQKIITKNEEILDKAYSESHKETEEFLKRYFAKTKAKPPKAPEVKAVKEIEYEKTITEPAPGPKMEPRVAKKVVPTGQLDPTKPEEALKIIKRHKEWLEGSKHLSPWEGIYETAWDKEVLTFTGKKGGWVKKSVEYTPEQIDTAYRTVQKSVPSPMPDTELFAMPGKEAQMKAIAQKMQKVKPIRRKVPKAVKLTKPSGLPKAKTAPADHIKAVYMAASKEETRYAINGVKVEGDTIVATDGRRMAWAKGKWGKDGLYLDATSLKNGLLGKPDKRQKFPKWQDIVPDVSDQKPILVPSGAIYEDLDTVLRRIRQAASITTEESKGVIIIENKDGSLGFAAASPEVGHVEINVQLGGRILGAVNPRFLLDVLRFHAIRGNDSFEFYFPNPDRPMLTKSFDGKTNTLTMPVSMGGEEPSEAIKKAIYAPKPKGKPGFVDVSAIGDLDKFLMGEIEPALETKSPAFNKHIDYFQKRQLPETSQIKEIQKQMRIVNGKRLAGTITAKEANKKIQQLRKLLFETAQKEGISVRMTKGGKVSIAVRKAGTYVPEEFSQYGKFKDTYPLGQDITRSVQQIDGALTVKEKVKLKGQAGATERYVLWPTREMSKHKLEYIKEKSTQLKKVFKTKRGTKEDAQINIVLEKIAKEDRDQPIKSILNTKTIKALGVKPSVVNQAIELRKFYDDLIDEQNQARKMRNQDPIPYRRNYSPHILRDVTIWERMMMKGQKAADVIAKKADLPDYIKPNKPFNPREMAREAGIPYDKRVKSATELAESYLVTAAKDIFNTSIIQNNKAFIQQLETMGYEKPARFLGDWTAESYAGIAPALDRGIKLTQVPKAQRAMRYFNRIRNLAVFPLNFSWNLLTQTSSLALTVGRYGTVNTARGFYQWLHPSIRKQTAKDYYSYIVKSARQGKITRQDAQNLIGEEVKLRRTKTELARDISVFFLEQLEKLLTGTSIRAARLHGAKRGLTGEALKNYASDGGAKTQSMYNDEDKPALLRSVMVKTGAPYQTFAYEVMNTLREWAGRTGTPPDTKLYTLWTVLRFLAAATVFAAIAKKGANKDIWSWKRPPIPFAEFWLSPIIRIFSKEYIGGSASGLTSPVETARRVAKGIDDVLETNNWRKLRNELIKYGPGIIGIPGGVQWSRTVDAIIAYSQGGVRDRRGRLLFKMKDPQDLIQGIFSGVWTTKGGRAYLEKRTGKKPEGKRKKRMEREKRMLRK